MQSSSRSARFVPYHLTKALASATRWILLQVRVNQLLRGCVLAGLLQGCGFPGQGVFDQSPRRGQLTNQGECPRCCSRLRQLAHVDAAQRKRGERCPGVARVFFGYALQVPHGFSWVVG